MKRYLNIVLVIIFTASTLNAGWWAEEGSGNITKKERQISNINGVKLKTVGNVYVKQGTDDYLRIDTDDNLHSYVTTKVENGVLVINTKKAVKPTKLNIFVTLKECEILKIDGAGNIEFVDDLKTNKLNLEIDGTGDIEIEELKAKAVDVELNGSGDIYIPNVKAEKVNIELAGTGDIKFIGKGKNCNVEIMGTGDIDMDDFEVEDFTAQISGSGDITVHATKSLTAEVFGSGDILYVGNPPIIKLDSFGTGTIRKK